MSSAMVSIPNVATLADDLLANFFTVYNIDSAHTALIVFGPKNVDSTEYFNTFTEVCDHLTSSEAQTIINGMFQTNLSEVYTTFRDDQLPTGRQVKKVFVVITAITDPENVKATISVSDQIRSKGAYVILVSLNNPNQLGNMSRIADQVIYTTGYTIGDASNILGPACQLSQFTTPVTPRTTSSSSAFPMSSQPTPVSTSLFPNTGTIQPTQPITSMFPNNGTGSPPTDDPSNAMGTLCSTNSSNVWLDLYFLIDVSKGMLGTDLGDLGGQLYSLLEGLTIGQTPKRSTRVGIITYATNVTVRLTLTACDNNTFFNTVFQLQNFRLPNDGGTNIKAGLETILNLTKTEQSYRRTAIIIVAASYDPNTADDASQIADIIKEDGTTILTIAYESPGTTNANLANLSTLGYSYRNNDPNLYSELLLAFTQINCFCPPKTYQYKVYDETFKNFTVFADCVYGSDGGLDPAIAERICEGSGAVLASVASKDKLDFIIDHVVTETMPKTKQFTVGAHLVSGQWVWYGYNNTVYPASNLPDYFSNEQGSYTYFNNTFGFNWEIHRQDGGFKNAKSYICQSRACDADFLCNVDPHSLLQKKSKKVHQLP
uniref:VWFA domain-containing protein n=1 Tax=Panagrolaimus sp. JU765 TaxID=591449 RepID=A0AC34RC49_9BILA